MMHRTVVAGFVAACLIALVAVPMGAQRESGDGPRYAADGKLVRPADYREWRFLTSGLGMTYGPAAAPAGSPQRFDNVFVNPSAYRHFMQTGRWPERAIFILEIRAAATEGSINRAGQFQTGVVAIEAAVKDDRFPDKWAYFDFGGGSSLRDEAEPLPRSARCYACHSQNTAVEQTFVQFYPTLLEVAKRMGTIKPSYVP